MVRGVFLGVQESQGGPSRLVDFLGRRPGQNRLQKPPGFNRTVQLEENETQSQAKDHVFGVDTQGVVEEDGRLL